MFACFCPNIRPFQPGVDFVILIHPIEVKRRRMTTGRLSHLSLLGSHFFIGHLFNHHEGLSKILTDPGRQVFMLYPGRHAIDLSRAADRKDFSFLDSTRRLTLLVIDGTWATARQTVNQSRDLDHLKRICFTPRKPSNFRVRKQPRPECYSTVEAIHETLDLLAPAIGLDTSLRPHDGLLRTFNHMVDRQIQLAGEGRPGRHGAKADSSPKFFK